MNEVRPEVTYCFASNVLAYTWTYRVQSILLSSMMITSIGTRVIHTLFTFSVAVPRAIHQCHIELSRSPCLLRDMILACTFLRSGIDMKLDMARSKCQSPPKGYQPSRRSTKIVSSVMRPHVIHST